MLCQVRRLATTEAGVAEVERNRGDARRKFMGAFIARLGAAGLLREGVGEAEAVLVVETVLRFADFDYLYTSRKLSLAKTTALLTAVLERAILGDGAAIPARRRDLAMAEA